MYVWVFVQLIHRPMRTKNQLYKTQTLPNSRIPDTSVDEGLAEYQQEENLPIALSALLMFDSCIWSFNIFGDQIWFWI